MDSAKFVYVTYIAAKPQAVWDALLEPEFTRQYWGFENVSDWKPGSTWEHRKNDKTRTLHLVGQVLESNPPRRLMLTWAEPSDRDHRDRHTRVTFEIETIGEMARLTVTHDQAGAETLRKISAGWPRVLSSLKSLLETGKPLDTWA